MTVSRAVRCGRAALAIQWRAARGPSLVAAGLALCGAASSAGAVWFIKLLVDELARGPLADGERAMALAAAAAACGGVALAIVQATQWVNAAIKRRIALEVEGALYAKVIQLEGLKPFEDPVFHDRLKMAEQGAQQAPHAVAELVYAVVHSVVTLSTLVGVVLAISPLMVVLLVAIGALALGAQVARVRRDAGRAEGLARTYRWRDFYRSLLVDRQAAKETRLFGLGELLRGRMMAALGRATEAEVAIEGGGARLQMGFALAAAAVTALGACLVVRGAIAQQHALGDVVLFLAAVAGIDGAFGHVVMQLSVAGPQVATFEKYLDVLALEVPRARERRAPAPLERGIELHDVWFRYAPDAPWVLKGVTFEIPAGTSVGLVGLNGAGKSTLIKLLCRLYEPERGQICWDGVPISQLQTELLLARVAVTFQDFMTWDLSAAENIGLGNLAHLTDVARIRRAAAQVGIDGRLEGLSSGYQTLLSRMLTDEAGSEGALLSGGEWQRVAIARCLMREDVDLMILDEPSSGLDAEAEAELHQALEANAPGRARLLISHRLGCLRHADTLVVLADGVVAERGTHAELIARRGHYARLFALQARGYQELAA
ncbi:MAG: ABC transporter ATP-binding protein [Archangiaceae bacterium]|nr:ABC transporter ATP-binding protein [Archangiaceae bacterium]